jgi:pimeloyl-ACP methyl ester carboxylesterase
MAERYPAQYDGALAMCAPLGGGVAEIEYAADFRVIFDYYFPGLLPGTTFDVPPGAAYLAPGEPGGPSPLFLQVYGAITTNPSRTFQWLSAAKIPFNPAGLPASAIQAGLYVVGFQLRYVNDFIERVNGKTPYDNTDTEYAVNVADPATNAYLSGLLNAGVARYLGDQAALNYYAQNYEPTGEISFPVLTLHGVYDPAVPIFHELMFLQKVGDAGRTEWLLQRSSTTSSGHCGFSAQEMLTAFTDLVTWVHTGTKP